MDRTSSMLARGVGVAALMLAGCGDPPPTRHAVELDGRQSSDVIVDGWRFSDGTTVEALQVPTEPLKPGASFPVSFEVSGPGRFEVSVQPPRAAARQVARGGPGAPPITVDVDPRTHTVQVEGQGRLEVTLQLQAPWHPRTAVVSLRRIGGTRTLPVVAGPRRHDGQAILAVLDVEPTPTAVTALRATPQVDGDPSEAIWAEAGRTSLVGSLQGEPVRLGAPREDAPDWGPTEVAFAWDDTHLYVAAWLPDRDIRGTFTERDQPIWKEEVFELFVFGDDRRADYLELQVSPRGVQFDARFERYRKGDEAWNGGYAAPVQVRGTLEDPTDRDEGWTTELAVPWADICAHTEVQCPVGPHTTLRINTFRLERPRKGPTVGLALSPTRVPDFHAPKNAAVLELLP